MIDPTDIDHAELDAPAALLSCPESDESDFDDDDDGSEPPDAAAGDEDAAADDDDDEAVELEKAAALAYFNATGPTREAHPPALEHFAHPGVRGLVAELLALHARGWCAARPFVELAPLPDLGPVEWRAWLRVCMPLTAPPLERALADLAAEAVPRIERAQARLNRELVKGRK